MSNYKDKRLRNYYDKVLSVQRCFSEHYKEGLTIKYIYLEYIKEKYFISQRTFFRYLNIRIKQNIEGEDNRDISIAAKEV